MHPGDDGMTRRPLTYKSSGVDIAKADAFVGGIGDLVRRTQGRRVLKRRGAFGGLFALGGDADRDAVLVSSTDGVGTKLLIAQSVGRHDTVGIDLVAMNVNDILCTGARPLFFLDYIACGRLRAEVLTEVVRGIAAGCREAGCSLVGGETAEMPGMYGPDEYDLAGFAVGVVSKAAVLDGSAIRAGDRVIGLASSGLHSNGFSLVRRVFPPREQRTLAGELLRPTRIYVRPVLPLLQEGLVRAAAHVTGGAFHSKITRVLPSGLGFRIHRGRWPVPEIFDRIRRRGAVSTEEMFRTFNMGIGMILVTAPERVAEVRRRLRRRVAAYEIGEVVRDPSRPFRLVA